VIFFEQVADSRDLRRDIVTVLQPEAALEYPHRAVGIHEKTPARLSLLRNIFRDASKTSAIRFFIASDAMARVQ
jgi:hypothetical protein